MMVIFLSFTIIFATPQQFDKNEVFKQMPQVIGKTEIDAPDKSIVNEIRFFRIQNLF